MCFSSNCVFGGYDDGVICSWSMKSGDLKSTLKGHTKSITELEMVNQTLLASASLDSTIRLWDIQVHHLLIHSFSIPRFCWLFVYNYLPNQQTNHFVFCSEWIKRNYLSYVWPSESHENCRWKNYPSNCG